MSGVDVDTVQLWGRLGFTNLTNYAWYEDNSDGADASGGAEVAQSLGPV